MVPYNCYPVESPFYLQCKRSVPLVLSEDWKLCSHNEVQNTSDFIP